MGARDTAGESKRETERERERERGHGEPRERVTSPFTRAPTNWNMIYFFFCSFDHSVSPRTLLFYLTTHLSTCEKKNERDGAIGQGLEFFSNFSRSLLLLIWDNTFNGEPMEFYSIELGRGWCCSHFLSTRTFYIYVSFARFTMESYGIEDDNKVGFFSRCLSLEVSSTGQQRIKRNSGQD